MPSYLLVALFISVFATLVLVVFILSPGNVDWFGETHIYKEIWENGLGAFAVVDAILFAISSYGFALATRWSRVFFTILVVTNIFFINHAAGTLQTLFSEPALLGYIVVSFLIVFAPFVLSKRVREYYAVYSGKGLTSIWPHSVKTK